MYGYVTLEALGNMKLFYIENTPKSTLKRSDSNCFGSIYESYGSFWKLIVLDTNNWYNITEIIFELKNIGQAGWSCIEYRLQKGKTPSTSNEDTQQSWVRKKSDGEAPVRLELYGIEITPLLLSLPGTCVQEW